MQVPNVYPPLTPIMADWIRDILRRPELLAQAVQQYHSPVNILHPASLEENYHSYQQLLESYALPYRLFFARKANKARCFVQQASSIGCGVDTASLRELQQCLDMGCAPADLVVTAAIKNELLLRLAVRHQVLVVLDNKDEAMLIRRIALEEGLSVPVGLRISGFVCNGKKLFSRFGCDISAAKDFIQENFLTTGNSPGLYYQGMHFHLNGYSIAQRAQALKFCLELSKSLSTMDYHTTFIDIGGGLLINYLEKEKEWDLFQQTLKDAVQHRHPAITYENDGLGYVFDKLQGIRGSLATYPYFNTCAKEKFLEAILEERFTPTLSIAQALKESGIELRMEPGRSLLDQAGITVARVANRKTDTSGNVLVGLEMNMTQLCSSSADFLLDPVVIFRNKNDSVPVAVNFTGAYCLERDVLLKRKIWLKHLPEVGDLVAFVNTAGYMMHFFESEAHLFDLAANLVYAAGEGSLKDLIPDENVFPL